MKLQINQSHYLLGISYQECIFLLIIKFLFFNKYYLYNNFSPLIKKGYILRYNLKRMFLKNFIMILLVHLGYTSIFIDYGQFKEGYELLKYFNGVNDEFFI